MSIVPSIWWNRWGWTRARQWNISGILPSKQPWKYFPELSHYKALCSTRETVILWLFSRRIRRTLQKDLKASSFRFFDLSTQEPCKNETCKLFLFVSTSFLHTSFIQVEFGILFTVSGPLLWWESQGVSSYLQLFFWIPATKSCFTLKNSVLWTRYIWLVTLCGEFPM